LRYLRIPADEQDGLDGFARARAALADPALRELAVQRYAVNAVEGGKPELVNALQQSASRAIRLFAGAEPMPATPGEPPIKGGLPAVSAFLEANVPEAERERASDVLVRILNGTLFELLQISRERAGLQPLPRDEKTSRFMTGVVMSLSDAFYYPAPMSFQLKDYQHVQASVFQVARAPGQTIVYLGCILLIVGVFTMLYVRERRVWLWLAPAGDGRTQASMALSSNRKTMEADQEFQTLKTQLLEVKP
jgi:cytochrome c biogenesis protein